MSSRRRRNLAMEEGDVERVGGKTHVVHEGDEG